MKRIIENGTSGARYEIVGVEARKQHGPKTVTIRDLGPWDQHNTITDAAEAVVEELRGRAVIGPGDRLLCYDSRGHLSEIPLDDDARFGGFWDVGDAAPRRGGATT